MINISPVHSLMQGWANYDLPILHERDLPAGGIIRMESIYLLLPLQTIQISCLVRFG